MVEAQVSIIIPVFNREKLVVRAVRSCLDQTYKNLEVVCIDDGSTDASFGRLLELSRSDPRVRVFRNEKRKGAAGARNTGLLRSTGEYVGFLDSDDIFKPFHVEEVMSALIGTNADWAFANFERSLADGKVTDTSVIGRDSPYITSSFSDLGGNKFISTAEGHAVNFVKFMQAPGLHTSIVKRAVIEGLSFDERVEIFEDWKFRFDAIRNGVRFVYLDIVTHRYYSHADNTTNTAGKVDLVKRERMAEGYDTLLSAVDKSALHKDVRVAFRKKSASMLFWEFGIPMLRAGKWRHGQRFLARSLLMDPLNAEHLRAVLSILVKRRV